MPERLDVATVRRWCDASLAALRRHRDEIDDLNVFPVPDGDTGTNLLMTTVAAVDALEGARTFGHAEDGVGAALLRLARGALIGARGNSGVILAQFFRGFADTLSGMEIADGPALAKALGQARDAAYRAVATPVEGTILTVAAHAASAVSDLRAMSVIPVAEAAASAARVALARTPLQLPDLARAGVPDAGGFGLAVVLDALVEAVGGRAGSRVAIPSRGLGPLTVAREAGSERFAYEVQYLLETGPEEIEKVRAALCALGDCVAIVGGSTAAGRQPTWNVHVHVNDVGAAIEAGVEIGRPYRISVTRFAKRVLEARAGAGPGPSMRERAVVALCDGDGLQALFAGERAVVAPLNHGRPSETAVLDAIVDCRARQVVILPNTPPSDATATVLTPAVSAARERGIHATVIPTRSPVQGLAALAVHDPARCFEDDVIAMAEAAGACRHAQLIRATDDALTVVGQCRRGDVLALVDGEVNLIGRDVLDVGRDLLDRLLAAGGELVTLVTGAQAPKETVPALTGHLRAQWPFVEVQWYVGDQPDSPLLIGVE